MKSDIEYLKQQKLLENTPYAKYKKSLWNLEQDFNFQKAIIDKELKVCQALCKHDKTYYHTGPDGWCECLICGKAL